MQKYARQYAEKYKQFELKVSVQLSQV